MGEKGTAGSGGDEVDTGDYPPIHVLYVDSDTDNAHQLKEALETLSESFSVTAVDGTEVQTLLAENGVDCVVSDYDLTDMDGEMLLSVVAEYENRLPFVLFTERGSEEIVSGDIAAKVTDYLRKGSGADEYVMLANRIANVVEKRRTERELEDLKELYELVARSSSDAFWDWNLETGVVERSDGFTTIFGYPEAEIEETYDWWLDRIHPDDRERVRRLGRVTFESQLESYEDEYRFRRADGTYAHILARARAVYDDDGGPVRMVGSLTDISALKTQTEELRQSRQLYRALVDNFPMGSVILFDRSLRVLVAGGTVLTRFGLTPETMERMRLPDLDIEAIEDRVPKYRTALDGERLEWDERIGGYDYHLQSLPVYDDNGRVFAGILVVQDITDRKRHERELGRQNERLESFGAMLSHDLRNPLSVARGYLDLARDEHDSEHLEAVAAAHERMSEIIEDVLALARHGEAVEETTTVSLADQAQACWVNVVSEEATLDVVDDLRFEADARRLNQLFENLFSNAVEHGSTGSQTKPDDTIEQVTVTVGPLNDGNGFFVEDDGPGIPTEDREQVFETGFSTGTEGTGLGLSIVSEIAGAHGWTVAVTEADSGGARFEVRGVTLAQ
jgi:PAS domain S-box-containing protein